MTIYSARASEIDSNLDPEENRQAAAEDTGDIYIYVCIYIYHILYTHTLTSNTLSPVNPGCSRWHIPISI